jgi:predicted glycoside hydrolase/deacetylase ChbG (UPF0249 family)
MPPRLILNADDFGLTPGINRAIAELHVAGCLTSATLMATGPAFDDAVRIARHQPTLGIGCHIVLVDGTPVLPPETLPTLCPEPDEIQSEAAAQIRRIQEAGIYPTHLDTHKHAHIFTRVAKALYLAAQRTGVRAIRNPFEPRHIHSHALLKRRIEIAALHLLQPSYRRATAGILTTDGTLGIAATGSVTARTLRGILESLPADGTYELVCHPGHNDADLEAVSTRLREHREIELHALLHEIPRILTLPNAPTLIHYSEL